MIEGDVSRGVLAWKSCYPCSGSRVGACLPRLKQRSSHGKLIENLTVFQIVLELLPDTSPSYPFQSVASRSIIVKLGQTCDSCRVKPHRFLIGSCVKGQES